MKVKGSIEIDVEKKTVSNRLTNGSYCLNNYTNGIKRFLDEEIQFVSEENKEYPKDNPGDRSGSAI